MGGAGDGVPLGDCVAGGDGVDDAEFDSDDCPHAASSHTQTIARNTLLANVTPPLLWRS